MTFTTLLVLLVFFRFRFMCVSAMDGNDDDDEFRLSIILRGGVLLLKPG